MGQVIVLWGAALLLLVGFVLYPRLMFGLVGSLLRGMWNLAVDCVALLFVWI